jgi:hypothetical protein
MGEFVNLVAVYKCERTGGTFRVKQKPLDDVPSEAVDCKFHKGKDNAILINIHKTNTKMLTASKSP